MNVYILLRDTYDTQIKGVYADMYAARLGAVNAILEDLKTYGLYTEDVLTWVQNEDGTVWYLTNELYPKNYNLIPTWSIQMHPVTRIF